MVLVPLLPQRVAASIAVLSFWFLYRLAWDRLPLRMTRSQQQPTERLYSASQASQLWQLMVRVSRSTSMSFQ